MDMGFMGSLNWVNAIGRKKCRSLFWRMRAALKRAMKKNSGKQRMFRFQYDPSSYALNFDDGCWKNGEGGACAFKPAKLQEHSDINTTLWVCVLLINAE